MLRRVITRPPSLHEPTTTCPLEAQRAVGEAWNVGVGTIMMNTSAHNTQSPAVTSTFQGAMAASACWQCKELVDVRISEILDAWAVVKRTV